jgi:hypothetical protein
MVLRIRYGNLMIELSAIQFHQSVQTPYGPGVVHGKLVGPPPVKIVVSVRKTDASGFWNIYYLSPEELDLIK